MKKRLISMAISAVMIVGTIANMTVCGFAETAADKAETELQTEADAKNEPVLAYVPLDNRPVNVDRVVYEAESAGFKVEMPDEDMYKTCLDGQPLNSNGTQYGDSEKLMAWVREMDDKTDYFVISLDQLLSGGLVNSRVIDSQNYSTEYKMIDELVKLSKTNHVYVIDTVARLATCTVGYNNADLDTYNYLRNYSLIPRYVIKNKDLSVKNIVSYYKRNEKGALIEADTRYKKAVNSLLKVRERKLHIIDYILSMDSAGNMRYFIGIDDSNPQNTIQTNEVNYIKKKLGSRGMIYSGADELGMMAVLNLMIDCYGSDVTLYAKYFGNTESTGSGSVYDMETVKENVEKHISSIGVKSTENRDEADIEVVVLTSPEEKILNSKYVSDMIDYINDNISKNIPTIVINSAPGAYSGNLEYRMIRECEMGMLLSYSSWGTVGNSIGVALCNGISRYLYLGSRTSSTDYADIAFLKGLTFSLEKDISYIRGGGKTLFNNYLTENGWSTSNFYQNDEQVKTVNAELEKMLETKNYNVTVSEIIDNLTGCRYVKGLNGECGIIGKIDLDNYSAPFYRTYEIRFDIDVKLKDITLNGVKETIYLEMPYTPAEGKMAYSLNLYYMNSLGKLEKLPCVYDKESGKIKVAVEVIPNFYTESRTMDIEKAESLFSDVPSSAWYFDYVMFAYEKGIMNGTSATTFSPKNPMTVQMLMKALERLSDKTDMEAVRESIAENRERGLDIPDIDSKEAVTREQFAFYLWSYARAAGMDMNEGRGKGIFDYADGFAAEPDMREGLDWVCRNGIITGTGDGSIIAPKNTVTRAEAAAALKRLAEMQDI
ncbi:MAG: DUF4127 family protein [Anaerovoracaceae bacterium]